MIGRKGEMMKVDLQALIDMPGAGKARKALVKAGKWNAAGPTSPDHKEFTVILTGTATAQWSKRIKVWALDEDAAEDRACDLDFDIDDEDITDIDDIEIDDAKVKRD